jgi:hypothetical protein
MPEIIEWRLEEGRTEGLAEGELRARLDNARKMREYGIAWAIATDVTGIKPEELPQPQ